MNKMEEGIIVQAHGFMLDISWWQSRFNEFLPPPYIVFTTFLSMAFHVMHPILFACSLFPQPHWGGSFTVFSCAALALTMHWHKAAELIYSPVGPKKTVSHFSAPFLLSFTLNYGCPQLLLLRRLLGQASSALGDWSFSGIWSNLTSSAGKVFSLPPLRPPSSSNPFIWYLQYSPVLSPGDLSPAVHDLLNQSHFLLNT